LIFSHSSSFSSPSSKVSATAVMHSITTPSSVNYFWCWPKIQSIFFNEHSFARSWAVNAWERTLVDRSYWALSEFILRALTSDCRGYVCSKDLCFVS
jgi:hypothetical protein